MHTDLTRPSADPGAVREALYDAVTVASLAPSILNSQPWQWVIRGNSLSLRADRGRQVTGLDPDGRLLALSCGAALHHATVELTGVGYRVTVHRLPEPAEADLLGRIVVEGVGEPDAAAAALSRNAWGRRTDRRPFADTAVAAIDLADLQRAGRDTGVVVHEVTAGSRSFLATAASAAADIQARSVPYRAALDAWVGPGRPTGDGIPLSTVTTSTPRLVPLRDFALGTSGGGLDHGGGNDIGASYLVVATADDGPVDWLAAGEATSAILLTATERRLAASPMSDVVEVPGARALIRSLLPMRAQPQLVIRVGIPVRDMPAPNSPRRPVHQTVRVERATSDPRKGDRHG